MTEENRQKCKDIILEAGRRLLSMHELNIEQKTDFNNLVTSCDKDTQEFLTKELAQIDPEATFLCEENHLHDASGDHMFIIDPIDGTSNFIHDFRLSGISVAYADQEKVLWGMIYNPYMKEFFEAALGEGAYLNGKRIQVRNQPLEKCLVNFGTSPYYQEWQDETFEFARFMKDHCIDLRRTGSAALDYCYTACGRCGLFYEREQQAWDFAAGMCIVKEAGGITVNFEGKTPDHRKKTGAVVGPAENVEAFFRLYEEFKKQKAAGHYKFTN